MRYSTQVVSLQNTLVYKELLRNMIRHMKIDGIPGIIAEARCLPVEFEPSGIIEGSSEKYLEHEFAWYKSMDLSIKNHPGIEKNIIWQGCAAPNGNVNSNYGWCVFSKENGDQFTHACNALMNDKNSRRAEIIYTRPSIHVDQCDDVHAHQDMTCTNYIMFLIRNNTLELHVHMRSNDVWYGLRYDLAWQQYVYNEMYNLLKTKYADLKKGKIIWIADSLHLYERNVEGVKQYIGE